MGLVPEIHGSLPIRSSAEAFVAAFQRRVAAGLLSGQPHPRANYAVINRGPRRVRARAMDWWTAIAVGLNEIELQLPDDGSLRYRIRYWRWSGYTLGLCGALGLIGIVLILSVDVRGYIAREPAARWPGLSVDQALLVLWGMVVFWGVAWPWVLIALHKRPLRRLFARLVAEVDADAESHAR